MNETVVQVRGFRKSYGDFTAVAGISFDVQSGEIFGLLGPNGAGKTSTLECLEGLRKPDAGTLRIMDIDPVSQPRSLRNLIGVQLQTSGMPDSISVSEAMRLFCAYHGIAPRFDLLERLGLADKLRAEYAGLSGGQKQRLALALAIAHNPQVVFLDEPTTGLDVPSRAQLHDLIRELQGKGITIILSTHDMAEAEKLADRVAILVRGQIVASGSPRELTATGAAFTRVSVRTEGQSLSNGAAFAGVSQKAFKDDYAVYYSTDPAATVAGVLDYIKSHDDSLIDLRVERPSLEERFLEIATTGEKSS
jgi:ABC-2 type transport system ATP-binding protein